MAVVLYLLCEIVLLTSLANAGAIQSQQLRSVAVGEFEGIMRSNFPRQRNQGTALECQLQCLKDEECMSFFYDRYNGTCQTHDVVFFNPNDGLFSPGSQYYRQAQDFCPSQLGYIYSRALHLCYKFHYKNAVSYSSASQVCSSENGRLVITDDVKKLYHLGRTMRASTFAAAANGKLGFLAGASDKITEGQWRWSDGQTLPTPDPSYWCPGKPNDLGPSGEDHVQIEISSDRPGCLNDVSELFPQYFICEIPM